MSAVAKKHQIETLTLTPSEMMTEMGAAARSRRSLFIWGPPGIAKSALAQGLATQMGIAFVDVRLSQFDPTDLRGLPYPSVIFGQHGVRWSTPFIMPRDLDLNAPITVDFPEVVRVDIRDLNPLGTNGIRYVRNVDYEAKSLTPGLTAKITASDEISASVGLYDADGNLAPGAFRLWIRGKAHAIIAYEEFNSAAQAVMAASYQLILDYRLGEYVVPEGCIQFAMGNRETDKGVTFRLPTPIANRFVHVEMAVNFDDWQVWALGAMVHPDVIGYLSASKGSLFKFEPSSATRGFPTPRTWHFVSDYLKANAGMNLPERVMLAHISGCIGEGEAVMFMEFRMVADKLPKPDEILSGHLVKMRESPSVQLSYALATMLCYELKERAENTRRKAKGQWSKSAEGVEWMKQADTFIGFIMENFESEVCVMAARAGIMIHKLPFDTRAMKNFDVFGNRFKQFIIS